MIAPPAERTAREGDPIVRTESGLDADPLVLRLAVGLLLTVLLPVFALTFLASITLAIVLLPLALLHSVVRGRPRGALPHEARASPSHRGERRDISRA